MKKEKPRRGVLGGAFNIYRMGWLLEGAAGTFERGGKAAATAEIAEDTVRDLHAKIGD